MNPQETVGEFKTFITKGNVVDLAVGVLIGVAFGDFVKAFTGGIIQPLLNLFGGGPKVSLHLWVFDIGLVINALIAFLITAAVLFFLVVKPMNKLKEITARKEAAAAPAVPEDIVLLTEIRDLLKAQAKPALPASGTGLV